MLKSYYQHHHSLSPDEAYEGLLSYGMFSDNLPSFLQSINFFDWCTKQKEPTFQKEETTPVYYESIRNIGGVLKSMLAIEVNKKSMLSSLIL